MRETLVTAVEAYEEQQILGAELPLFQAYLANESDGPDDWRNLESADVLGDQERFYLIMQILTDSNYAEYLERNVDSFTAEEVTALEHKRNLSIPISLDSSVFDMDSFLPISLC